MNERIDVGRLIDARPIGPLQMRVFLLCFLVALLDGLDTQSVAVAAPILSSTLGFTRAALGPVFAAGHLGAFIGAFLFGPLGDRIGRRRGLIIAAVLFGGFTILTGFARTYGELIAMRFCAGVGLGGALPCFIALAAEYAPSRRRAMIASLMWSGFSLGFAVGGFINAYLLSAFGWHSIFVGGGVAGLVVAGVLAAWLPESLSFLISAGRHTARVVRIVRMIDPGIVATSTTTFRHEGTDRAGEHTLSRSALPELFREGRGPLTLATWFAFLTAFGTLTVLATWIPIILRARNIGMSEASVALGIFGFGAFAGAALAGRLMERFGNLRVLMTAFLGGAALVGGCGAFATSLASVSLWLAGAGVFVSMGASGLVALAATVYPVAIRSTAVGCALGMGRGGQVIWPIVIGGVLSVGLGEDYILAVASLSALIAAFGVVLMRLAGRPSLAADDLQPRAAAVLATPLRSRS